MNYSRTPRAAASRLLGWLAPIVMTSWVACAHGAETPPAANPAGIYALLSVDGKEVPCTLDHGGHTLTIDSGRFIIARDGTCTSRMVFSAEAGQEATREVKATYTMAGSKLTMKWEGAGVTTGTLDGDTFTMTNEGMVLTYKK